MLGTGWSPFSVVSGDAIIKSSGDCYGNNSIDDAGFVFSALPTVSQFDCAGAMTDNTFSGPFGSGLFRIPLYFGVTQYQGLSEYGYSGVGPFASGKGFLGLAATAMNSGQHRSVAVLKSAPSIPPAGINGA